MKPNLSQSLRVVLAFIFVIGLLFPSFSWGDEQEKGDTAKLIVLSPDGMDNNPTVLYSKTGRTPARCCEEYQKASMEQELSLGLLCLKVILEDNRFIKESLWEYNPSQRSNRFLPTQKSALFWIKIEPFRKYILAFEEIKIVKDKHRYQSGNEHTVLYYPYIFIQPIVMDDMENAEVLWDDVFRPQWIRDEPCVHNKD